MSERRFGVSTHLFHESRLTREHLADIAGHGFEAVEVFATRAHFDYRDPRAAADLAEWLSDLRLSFHSMHAPIVEAIRAGKWVGSFSIAAGDDTRRKAAIAEIAATLNVARTVPFQYLVLHLGIPDGQQTPGGDNQHDAARRSVEEIAALAAEVNVRVALEVMPNSLSSAAAICHLIEDELEGLDVGICLDYGHANLMGDLSDAIETVSGHLWTTHVHDNDGRSDDHRVPFAGRIDWDAAMMETQKIGYDGVLMFEVANTGDPIEVLKRTVKARERLEHMFVAF
ncbi:MAG TPA: sugar phosphate isomerase/epimerase family protein [Vicinamibacterales bacterium]|nr:sugar phosphate isomerase/epimerase family protein [Vicinamibacterales bacterium]